MDMSNEWIDQSIPIDFKIPTLLQRQINEAEYYAKQGDYEYFGVAEDLDVVCKGFYRVGKITQKQWDIVCSKYHI